MWLSIPSRQDPGQVPAELVLTTIHTPISSSIDTEHNTGITPPPPPPASLRRSLQEWHATLPLFTLNLRFCEL